MVEAWRVEEALLRLVHEDASAHGAELRVVAISAAEQVHPDLEERRAVREVLGVESMFYVEDRIGRLARREGFPFLSLPEVMAEEAARTGVFFHGFKNGIPWGGHWNQEGHRFAGRWLAAGFCARLGAGKAP